MYQRHQAHLWKPKIFYHRILTLLKQQRKRREKFRAERAFEPCDAGEVLYQLMLLGQLGAGRYVGRL